MKYGARNNLIGKVSHIKKGAVMCQVTVKLGKGMTITSVMTLDSFRELNIKKGSKVQAIVKAVNVLLATDE